MWHFARSALECNASSHRFRCLIMNITRNLVTEAPRRKRRQARAHSESLRET